MFRVEGVRGRVFPAMAEGFRMVGRVWAYPLYRGEFREVGGGMRLPRFGLWDAGSPRGLPLAHRIINQKAPKGR